MKMVKADLEKYKKTKIVFKEVKSNADLKVQFVNSFPDYKVKVLERPTFTKQTIKIQIVSSRPDVKIKKVTSFGDFEAYFG